MSSRFEQQNAEEYPASEAFKNMPAYERHIIEQLLILLLDCKEQISTMHMIRHTARLDQDVYERITVILQIFGALKFRWRATAERLV